MHANRVEGIARPRIVRESDTFECQDVTPTVPNYVRGGQGNDDNDVEEVGVGVILLLAVVGCVVVFVLGMFVGVKL